MIAVTLAALLAAAPLQEPRPGPPPGPPPQGEALRLFLDCQWQCDLDYLRTEITFVNYVHDPADAQVHVLVTTQTTGGGGTEFTLTFIGLREFQGRADTLRYTTPATATSDETRRALALRLRLGLVRYVATTPLAERLEIRYAPPAGGAARPPADHWNFWVFRLGGNSYFNGEKSYSYRNINYNASANRTTDRWKIELQLNGNTSRNSYLIDDTTTFVSRRESYGASAGVVKSWGPHWSVGGEVRARRESYRNINLRWTTRTGIEYSIFPYSQSTRRLLLVRWMAGPEVSRYEDSTIYSRTSESRLTHQVEVEYTVTQPWGNASVETSFNQYLHDKSKLSLDTYGNMDVRIVRGLSVNVWGGYSVIHNQLYLPATGATPEEIIAQRRQLATSYSYFGGLGLSYRFGSIFNNVVNPRFGN